MSSIDSAVVPLPSLDDMVFDGDQRIVNWLLVIISFVSVALNGATLLVIATDKHLWSQSSNRLLANLSLADSIACIILGIQALINGYADEYTIGQTGCAVTSVIVVCTVDVAMMTLMAISIDRHLAVVKRQSLNGYVGRIVAVSWLIAGVGSIAPFLGWGHIELQAGGIMCGPAWWHRDANAITHSVLLLSILATSELVTIDRYWRIAQFVASNLYHRHEHKQQAKGAHAQLIASGGVTAAAAAPEAHTPPLFAVPHSPVSAISGVGDAAPIALAAALSKPRSTPEKTITETAHLNAPASNGTSSGNGSALLTSGASPSPGDTPVQAPVPAPVPAAVKASPPKPAVSGPLAAAIAAASRGSSSPRAGRRSLPIRIMPRAVSGSAAPAVVAPAPLSPDAVSAAAAVNPFESAGPTVGPSPPADGAVPVTRTLTPLFIPVASPQAIIAPPTPVADGNGISTNPGVAAGPTAGALAVSAAAVSNLSPRRLRPVTPLRASPTGTARLLQHHQQHHSQKQLKQSTPPQQPQQQQLEVLQPGTGTGTGTGTGSGSGSGVVAPAPGSIPERPSTPRGGAPAATAGPIRSAAAAASLRVEAIVAKKMRALAIVYVCTWSGYGAKIFYELVAGSKADPLFDMLVMVLAFMHAVTNPLLFLYVNERAWKLFVRRFCCGGYFCDRNGAAAALAATAGGDHTSRNSGTRGIPPGADWRADSELSRSAAPDRDGGAGANRNREVSVSRSHHTRRPSALRSPPIRNSPKMARRTITAAPGLRAVGAAGAAGAAGGVGGTGGTDTPPPLPTTENRHAPAFEWTPTLPVDTSISPAFVAAAAPVQGSAPVSTPADTLVAATALASSASASAAPTTAPPPSNPLSAASLTAALIELAPLLSPRLADPMMPAGSGLATAISSSTSASASVSASSRTPTAAAAPAAAAAAAGSVSTSTSLSSDDRSNAALKSFSVHPPRSHGTVLPPLPSPHLPALPSDGSAPAPTAAADATAPSLPTATPDASAAAAALSPTSAAASESTPPRPVGGAAPAGSSGNRAAAALYASLARASRLTPSPQLQPGIVLTAGGGDEISVVSNSSAAPAQPPPQPHPLAPIGR